MRNIPNLRAERCRVRIAGDVSSDPAVTGNCGRFELRYKGVPLLCIVGDAGGWDHVSVSVYGGCRCPTWEEMCFVRDVFWRDDETVIQYHPAKRDYVNDHPWTLHLWRPQTQAERAAIAARESDPCPEVPTPGPLPLPPKEFV